MFKPLFTTRPLKAFLALVSILSTVSTCKGEVIALESADYPATNSLVGLNGGYGWSSAWDGPNLLVAGSYAWPDFPSVGNRFSTLGTNFASFRSLRTIGREALLDSDGKFGKEGTTIYVSFMARTAAINSSNYAGISFFNDMVEECLVGAVEGQTNWSVRVDDLPSPAGIGASTNLIVNSQITRLVVRMTFGATGTNDLVELWINPSVTAPLGSPSATVSGGDIHFNRIRLASAATTKIGLDEIRMGTTWEDVNPAGFTVFNVTGGGSFCAGDSGVPLGLTGSQTAIDYWLSAGGEFVGTPVAGTGASLNFGNQAVSGLYSVIASNPSTAVITFMNTNAPVKANLVTLSPASSLVNTGAVVVFTTGCGQPPFLFSLVTNHSGGSITPTGTYTAGSKSGLDTVLVTDSLSNSLTATVTTTATINGGFARQAYVKASNTGASDYFGNAVAISGDTMVVAAVGEDSSATGVNGSQTLNNASFSGAAYVFVRSGTNWSQQAYLKASNTEGDDYFGHSVAISGDTIVVGAYLEDSSATSVDGNQTLNNAGNSGAAYVFVRNGTTWTQQAYLKASNTGANDQFGCSVGISGDTIVVGALREDSAATGTNGDGSDNSATDSGAAYVFVRMGTTWVPQAYLKASNTGAGDYFGGSVAISGDTIAVGAESEDSSSTGPNSNAGDNSAASAGAAYVFLRSGTNWNQQAYLKASNTESGDGFGTAVAISGDTLIAGAWGEDSDSSGVNGDQSSNSATQSGAAYIFARTETNWTQQAYLKASNPNIQAYFGLSVALSENVAVVGSPYIYPPSPTGIAAVFERGGTNWNLKNTLWDNNIDAVTSDYFGSSVAASGNTVVVGEQLEDSSATGINGSQFDSGATGAGAVFVYVSPVNHAPILMSAIPDTFANYGLPFAFTIPANCFSDTDAGQGLSFSAQGLPSGVIFASATRTFSGTPTTVATNTVTVTVVDSGSPNLNTKGDFFLITAKSPLLVTASNKSRSYAETNPPLSFGYGGFVLGETAAVLETPPVAGTAATNGSPVGPYPITVGGGVDDHYEFSYVNGTLNITPASLTVAAFDTNRVYGTTNPPLAGSIIGLVNGDTITASFTTAATIASPPGTYPITAILNDPDGKLGNYAVTTNNGTLTINGVAEFQVEMPPGTNLATGTAIYFGGMMSRYVDPASQTQAPDQTFTVTFTGIFPNPYAAYQIQYADSPFGIWTPLPASGLAPDAGGTIQFHDPTPRATAFYRLRIDTDTHRVFTIRNTGTNDLSGIGVGVTGTNAANFELDLNGTAVVLSPGASTTFAVTYVAFDTNARSAELSIIANVPSVFVLTLIGGDVAPPNHAPDVANPIPDANGVYGSPMSFTFVANTFSDPDAGQSLTYSASGLPPEITFTPATRTFSGTPTNIGTSSVTVTATDNGSPALSTNDVFDIVIAKAPLTATADDKSRTYAATNPPLTLSYSAFVLGETAAVLDTPPTIDTTATNGSAVGSYPVSVGGGADDHYELNYVNGTLNIAPALLTVTAFDTNRVYGTPNPPLAGSLVGVAWSDNITATFNSPATISDPPGTYPITPVFSDPDNKLPNYSVTTNNGTLTILSPPELSFTLGGGGGGLFTLSWPASYAGFVLESSESLTPPIDWQPVTSGITESGGTKSYTVTNDTSVSGRLYRLRLP